MDNSIEQQITALHLHTDHAAYTACKDEHINLVETRFRKTVSYYNNSEDSRSRLYYNLDYILEQIQTGRGLKEQTGIVRQQTTEEDYKREKNKLPMIVASGIFRYRNDDLGNLQDYSNLLVLDFDKFPDHEAAEAFKQKLIRYANPLHLYAVWFSPSNKGIKAVMIHDNTNPEYHYNLFRQVNQRLYPHTEEFDKKCSNLTRSCFLCYDPEIWVNPEKETLEPYHFEYDPCIPEPAKKTYNQGVSSKFFIHTQQEIEQNSSFQLLWKDKTLVNYVNSRWRKDYPDSYEDGHRHQSILSRAKWLCLYGVLYENALDYLKATFGRHGISEPDIEGMVINNYNANRSLFGSERSKLYAKKLEGQKYRMRQVFGE